MRDDLEDWAEAGRIAGRARDHGIAMIDAGVSYLSVAEAVEEFIVSNGAKPAFPVNIAINEVAAHYTPSHDDRGEFKVGDVVKLDVGAQVNGRIGDTADTKEVGTKNWSSLIEAARSALDAAISLSKAGARISDIGAAIEQSITARGFKPISNLTGHSMEPFNLHAGLTVPNVGGEEMGATLPEGTIVAIEPFATTGVGYVDGRRPGNIYRVIKLAEMRSEAHTALLSKIYEEHSSLPFSERWCHRVQKRPESVLRRMVRVGCITSYPVLREVGDGLVSQVEHTLLIEDGGCRVLTR